MHSAVTAGTGTQKFGGTGIDLRSPQFRAAARACDMPGP
jgi:hypothetical protein